MELKIQNVFVQEESLKAQCVEIVLSFELRGRFIRTMRCERKYLFFRKADILPKIYEAVLFEMRPGKGWVTSGKALCDTGPSRMAQRCAGSCGECGRMRHPELLCQIASSRDKLR